jgi:hypothetical protein
VPLVGLAAAGLCLLATTAVVPARPPVRPVAAPRAVDEDLRAALDLLYDGSTEAALGRLRALVASDPDDPLAVYLEALALCWKVEQNPDTTTGDRELLALIDRVLMMTAAPSDDASPTLGTAGARAHLARGGAFGVRSRLALFRRDAKAAARAGAAMRAALLPLRGRDDVGRDAAFGLGLYDYYADVLPSAAKVLRFFMGLPGGDRRRGLAAIEAAKAGSAFHGIEAASQLYEIDVYYEDAPDRALAEIRELRARYRGAPLWALKLTEHLRERLGRYGESAAVAREILSAAQRGEANFGPGAVALARLALGEALLLDLRAADAREALLAASAELAPEAALRARLLIGRTLELERERARAIPYYAAAARATDPAVREAAEKALARALPKAETLAFPLLAEARRLRESGRRRESAEAYRRALDLWDECPEARLRVAEDNIQQGRVERARATVHALTALSHPSPPWIAPWTQLLRAYVEDVDGRRASAVQLYKQVLERPLDDPDLVREATERLRVPFRSASAPVAPSRPANN